MKIFIYVLATLSLLGGLSLCLLSVGYYEMEMISNIQGLIQSIIGLVLIVVGIYFINKN